MYIIILILTLNVSRRAMNEIINLIKNENKYMKILWTNLLLYSLFVFLFIVCVCVCVDAHVCVGVRV